MQQHYVHEYNESKDIIFLYTFPRYNIGLRNFFFFLSHKSEWERSQRKIAAQTKKWSTQMPFYSIVDMRNGFRNGIVLLSQKLHKNWKPETFLKIKKQFECGV